MSKLDLRCDNCDFATDDGDKCQPWWEVDMFMARMESGEVIPFGICPDCEAFVHDYSGHLPRWEASKDMLEALGQMVRYNDADPNLYSGDNDGVLGRIMFNCRTAIAKAEGRKNNGS
jgi:hypothetical protein